MAGRVVTSAVSGVTNIPLRRVARDRGRELLGVTARLRSSVVKRSSTITGMAHTVHHGHLKLHGPGHPVNDFVFLNPANMNGALLTGCLTRCVFNSTSTLVHVSVDRFVRAFDMSHLINTPPKCINCRRNKRLARGVHHGPCSVILFSRVRGTGPRICGLLLRMLSTKFVASKLNEGVSFGGAIVVVASGINAQRLHRFKRKIKFSARSRGSGSCTRRMARGTLRGAFSPRFLGHVSSVVRFGTLSLRGVHHVAHLRVSGFVRQYGLRRVGIAMAGGTIGLLTGGDCSGRCNTHPVRHAVRGRLRSPVMRRVLTGKAGTKLRVIVSASYTARGVVVSSRNGTWLPVVSSFDGGLVFL